MKDLQKLIAQRKAEAKNPENDWLLKKLEEIRKRSDDLHAILNGERTASPTLVDRVATLEAHSAEMSEALNMILEGVVEE